MRTECTSDNGVQISVTDTGSGHRGPTSCRRSSSPFYTTKPVGRARAWPVAVVGIVERHGGSIKVLSEPGKGTTFNVRLPIDGPTGG